MVGVISLVTGRAGSSGFGSASTAEQVTHGIDASNLTAIVTGGASGIGLETARVLALRNVHVIIGVRNTVAAKNAKEDIVKQNPSARLDILQLDLCSLNSVTSFVHNFLALQLPLNILINNAGVMFCPFKLSENGLETQFHTNHLGHFLLTKLLLDKMKETAEATGIEGRIINLSSIAHNYTYRKGIRFHKLNERKGYDNKKAYGQSKLCNILHANELSRRLREEGVNIAVNSVHPGVIMTPLMRHSSYLMHFLKIFTFYIWKNIPQGAATTCYVALHPSVKGETGKYFVDCNKIKPSKFASNEKLGRKLWDFSEELINSISKA
ncbi:Short-chain dehydrogenase TIC 32 B, chloroplastic [Stylosanthes scabra]|uniref:Short-chain dehydrogenase TIC 32 B, chloroplastic n=1 Tax=Stylosanthes scabra TaxID=79078 RepID=A0ABU6RAW5_9FABA|nr:Short-chain dehydrogenase TIC 32 B, chloroplastic [Stylosanthes scabra]